MKRVLHILLWSAISAAFIGPGTVATAGAAGAGFGLSLLWALVFSTLACLALQEAVARLAAVSGLGLGEALGRRFGRTVPWLVVGAVVLGCAAYQAGNILGAVAGASLGGGLSRTALTAATGLVAAVCLWSGRPQRVARLLGVAVAGMGLAFLTCAVRLGPPLDDVLRGSLVPSLPAGAETLILGLVGTTVVPYNLFLGAGLARGQSLAGIRLGLGVAVPLGGIISAAILVTGTAQPGAFGYETLALALAGTLGTWAFRLFGLGLFLAGLSSAITAPLAAALAVRSLRPGWTETSARFRSVWLTVLLVGLAFGLTDVRPVPVIILAQAANGLLLPVVALFVLVATNDRDLLGDDHVNGWLANLALGVACLVSLGLGVSGVVRAVAAALGTAPPTPGHQLLAAVAVAVLLAWPVGRTVVRGREPVRDASDRTGSQ